MSITDRFDHPSWRVAAGTAGSYLAILLGMFLLLFVLPLVVFAFFV